MAEQVPSRDRNNGGQTLALLNEQSFKVLFNQTYTMLCRYSIRFVHKAEIAEEIVQDQFIYLWNNKNELNIHFSVQSYLFKAVRNKSIDYLRSKYARVKFSDDSEAANFRASDDPLSQLEETELKNIIDEAIAGLPEKCNTIFTLSRIGEMKNQEIADTLNISIKTVENQITIALKKIKSFLDKNWLIVICILSRFF